jgi:WD40 repeat protein
LLREWPRLRAWLEEDRQGRHLHRQLTEEAVAWEAEGRDPSALYRGVRLAAASDWASARGEDANALEREFLDRSLAAQDRELRATRRSARRLRSLAAALAVVLVAALVAGGLALAQRSNAIHQAATADASRLASQAEALADKNPDLSLLLAVEARRQQPSIATDGALEATLARATPGLDRIIHLTPPTVDAVASYDGRLLITPGQNGVVRVVDVASGRVVRTLPGNLGTRFATVAFTGDGAWLAGGGSNGAVIVWNLRTGVREATIRVGGGSTAGGWAPWGAPSGDGARLVTASGDGSVSVWDLSDPTRPRRVGDPLQVPAFTAGVPIIEPSPDGSRLAIGEFATSQTFIFDLGSHTLLRQLPGVAAGFSRDGTSLATALGDRIVLWDPATGQPLGAPLTGFSDATPVVFFNANDSLGATGDLSDNSVRVFDLASGRQIGAAIGQAYPLGWLADGSLAVGSATGATSEVRLYRVGAQSIPPIATALGTQAGVPSKANASASASANHGNPYTMAKFALHGTEVITESGPGNPLLAWQASTGRPLGPVLGGAVQAQNGFYPSPDGVLLAVSQADGRLEVWNLATRQRRAVVNTGNTSPDVAWMLSGRGLVTMEPGGKLAFWRVSESGQVSPRAHTTVEGIAPHASTDPVVSPDGRTVALTPPDAGNTIPLLDARSGRRIRILRVNGLIQSAVFSPDSKTLAVALQLLSQEGGSHVVMLDVATGSPRATLSLPYTTAAHSLAFVRGGAWLVTTSGVSTGNPPAPRRMDLWDAATLQPIGDPLTVPPDAAFPSPNHGGDKLGTGADQDNGLPLVWNMNPASWEATACRIAGRNLSHAEWNEYLAGQQYGRTCPQWPAGTWENRARPCAATRPPR